MDIDAVSFYRSHWRVGAVRIQKGNQVVHDNS